MALAGNIVWWVTLGPILSIFWFLIGCLMFASIIGIPFGRASFTIAKLCLAPFGKDIVSTSELRTAKHHISSESNSRSGGRTLRSIGLVAKVFWLPIGMFLAILHTIHGVALFIPILTIPLGVQSLKIAGLSLFPVGKRVVSVELARKVRETLADKVLTTR